MLDAARISKAKIVDSLIRSFPKSKLLVCEVVAVLGFRPA
jgi:hypothetical protein